MKLYHYTCLHGFRGISQDRSLRGNPHPLLPPQVGPLVWLTDLEEPNRLALGLTSQILHCDRTEYRAVVDTEEAMHWPEYARWLPRLVRGLLDGAPGAMPMHWWVAGPGRVPIADLAPTS